MKICYFNKCTQEYDKININNLFRNIKIIENSNINTIYSKYILKVFNKIFSNYKNEKLTDIYDKLKQDNIIEHCKTSEKLIDYDLVLSPSHDNTYYLIKQLNKDKKPLTIICFDMHCDAYDENVPLWKGNVFSKLLKEKYINDLIVVGMPKYKIKMTKKQISQKFNKHIFIVKKLNKINKILKKQKSEKIMFSIDLDCFNSYEENYTAIDYSPFTILNHLSHVKIKEDTSDDKLNEIILDSIFIKNNLGRQYLYKVGENYLNFEIFKDTLKNIINYCHKNKIEVGYNNKIITDITELSGEDLNYNTYHLIIKIIDLLKEVN